MSSDHSASFELSRRKAVVQTRVARWRTRFAGVVVAAGVLSSAIAHAATLQVVASGLNNPRGLDFAPNGALYIAEAGTGGSGPTVTSGDGALLHFGLSGSITRLFKGTQQRIVTGLPSLANAQQGGAIGPSDISFGPLGNAAVTIGLGQNPAVRSNTLGAAGAAMGTVWQMNQNGQMKLVADIAAFEGQADPDGAGPDSNPNGVLNDRAGALYVADAGGNTLLEVSAKGTVSVVAVFPARTVTTPPFLPQPPFPAQLSMQAVPTNVVRGPDGAFYVSQLTGFPFPAGGARIYRVVVGAAPEIYATGFTNIIDLEFDSAGNLYVLEIDRNGLLAPEVTGRLARVNAVTHTVDTVAAEGLVMPGGLAIGPDGAIYVSNFSTAAAVGQVVRIQP
jgi:sugar lactone lactonase YvrE